MTQIEMCWMDLETTGLDWMHGDVPIEVGLRLTDKWGSEVDRFTTLIHDETNAFKDAVSRGRRHEFVGPMHEKSGLWNDLAERELGEFGTIVQVERAIIEWLDEHEAPKLPLAGSSIGSLDRPFVRAFWPTLDERLHYRNIDISTIKELCRMLNAEMFASIQNALAPSEDKAHRVQEDIDGSIAEYTLYHENFLWVA